MDTYMDLLITHKYDSEHHIYYPREYSSYNDYKERWLNGPYTTTLLQERIKLLTEYQHITTNKSDETFKDKTGEYLIDDMRLEALSDDIMFNLEALKHRSDLFEQLNEISKLDRPQQIDDLTNMVKDRINKGIFDPKTTEYVL